MTTTTDLPTLDCAAIRARVDAATNGPWMAASWCGRAIAVLAGTEVQQRHLDAEFIAAARTDVPALLDALVAAHAEIERLRRVADVAIAWRRMRAGTPTAPKPESAALIEAVDKLTEGSGR